jgi:hypothetical protein
MGTGTPKKPAGVALRIGAIIFYFKRAFCGYLGVSCGLKSPRQTPDWMGRLILLGHLRCRACSVTAELMAYTHSG